MFRQRVAANDRPWIQMALAELMYGQNPLRQPVPNWSLETAWDAADGAGPTALARVCECCRRSRPTVIADAVCAVEEGRSLVDSLARSAHARVEGHRREIRKDCLETVHGWSRFGGWNRET